MNSLKNIKCFLQEMCSPKYLVADCVAGLSVASIALPLSLAVALASGVSVGAGLFAVIIGGLVAAICGGSKLAVSGPSPALALVMATVMATNGVVGVMLVGLICAAMQLGASVIKLGDFIKLIPLPVITAFISGIGVIILVSQIPYSLNLPTPARQQVLFVIQHIATYLQDAQPSSTCLAILALVIVRFLPKILRNAPAALIAVIVSTAITHYLKLPVDLVGKIPHGLSFDILPTSYKIYNYSAIFSGAITIFLLSSLETLLSASAIDRLKNTQHNPNTELRGQAIANFASSIMGGLPVAAAMARSIVNINAGAKTNRSAIIHSLAILGAIYLCPALIEEIPVAVLAGILINTAISMISLKELHCFWRKHDSIIYLITFIIIVVTDLIEGIQSGILLAFLFVTLDSLKTQIHEELNYSHTVLHLRLSGSIAFWSFGLAKHIMHCTIRYQTVNSIIIDCSNVILTDTTGANHLLQSITQVHNHNKKVFLCNLSDSMSKLLATSASHPATYTVISNEDLSQILNSR